MHDFEGDQFIIRRGTAGDEEKGGISTIDNLAVYVGVEMSAHGQSQVNRIKAAAPLYSRKLHILVRLDRTS